jgi:Contractile injection system tape measure protein
MGQQRHVIKRQIVEITLADKRAAWPLQQTLSRLFQHQFPAILDRYLSKLSPADSLHRIDYLELDLGELDGNQLEADILERIDATLSQALQEHIGNSQASAKAKQDEKKHSHLQLFEQFVREGTLPWWADNNQSQVPEHSLVFLSENDPKALTSLLAKLIQEPLSLHRLISYFDDAYLVTILALLTVAPNDLATSLLQTLLAVEAPLHQLTAMPGSRIRFTRWQVLMQVAIADEPAITRHVEFLTAVTKRWAKLSGVSHPALVGCFQPLLTNPAMVNNEWLPTVKLLSSTLKKSGSTQPRASSNPLGEDNTTTQQTHHDLNPPNTVRPEPVEGLNQRYLKNPSEDLTIDENNIFSETDTLYINNAGLCILWPYLATFFGRLELVLNGRFHNQETQQCAVSLLHYLATGELNPPEYLLPFNKLLCGMEIDEVYDLDAPLTELQLAACDELMTAIITNPPILNNMSHNGFRGSFLLRQGTLSTEAGSWLLRVERETYDVVLERFPWSWQWFKLPWMEHPVRVEW